jgi:hypothetical protein
LDFNMATGSVDTMEWFPYDFPGFWGQQGQNQNQDVFPP